MTLRTLRRAVDFFVPFLNPAASISFYGGEPLLSFNRIKAAVNLILSHPDLSVKPPEFSRTTNGTLITKGIADFFDRHGFTVLFSWDGPLQETQRGAAEQVSKTLDELKNRTGIRLETNTVVTPESVHRLSETMRFIYHRGIRSLHFSPDRSVEWSDRALEELDSQLNIINKWMEGLKSSSGPPVITLHPRSVAGPFFCPASTDRFSISAAGEVWGCFRFHDYFDDGQIHMQRERYCLGRLENFIEHFPSSLLDHRKTYMQLRPAYFINSKGLCLDCADVDSCDVCPVPFGKGIVGHILESNCRIQTILRRRREENRSELKNGKATTSGSCD